MVRDIKYDSSSVITCSYKGLIYQIDQILDKIHFVKLDSIGLFRGTISDPNIGVRMLGKINSKSLNLFWKRL